MPEYPASKLPSVKNMQAMSYNTLAIHARHVAEALVNNNHAILATYYLLENLDPHEAEKLRKEVIQGYENYRKVLNGS